MSILPEWRWYIRRKAPPQPWTDARRVQSLFAIPKTYLPAVFGGVVEAGSRAEALTLAQALNEDAKATVDVIAEAAWRTLTDLERRVFLGTFEPPRAVPEAVVQGRVRISRCKVCGDEIRHRLAPGKTRHGRPKLYCDRCIPARVLRWRKVQAARRAVSR